MTRAITTTLSVLMLSLASACGGSGAGGVTAGPMPEGGSFHGVFQSPEYGEMHLCQTGQMVMGDFQRDERRGTLTGTVEGDVLRIQWEQRREMVIGRPSVTRGRGFFRLSLDENGDFRFDGEWGHDDAFRGGGGWTGVRMRRGEPERCLRNVGDEETPESQEDVYANENQGDAPAPEAEGLDEL